MRVIENLSVTEASLPFTWPQASFSEVATVNTFLICPRTQYIDIAFGTPSLREKLGHLHPATSPLIIHLGDGLTSAHVDPQHSFGMAAWCSVMQHTIIIQSVFY